MNNSPHENKNKSGFKVRRSSMTRREAERHIVSPRSETVSSEKQGTLPSRPSRDSASASSAQRPVSRPSSEREATQRYAQRNKSHRRPATIEPTGQQHTEAKSTRQPGSNGSVSTDRTQNGATGQSSPTSSRPTSSLQKPFRAEQVASSASRKSTKRRSLVRRMEEAAAKKPQHRTRNDFIKPTDLVRIKGNYDHLFLILVIILTLFGIIMDFSASYAYAFSRYNDSFYFVKRQIGFAAFGMIALFFAMHFDYRWLRKVTVPIFIGVLVLLVLVLGYGVASGVAQRWIQVGPITIQPSEFMKFALVFMLALYVARNQDRITNYRNFRQSSLYGMLIPAAIVGIACFLIALEKHFSGTIIVFMIGMVIIFAAGARKFWFFLAGGGALALITVGITFVPYARERIDMLIHPENYSPTGKIWQTLQGLYAVGSGGIFGVGLGNSRQKHLYVSQPQNDFIFSIICEELGFAGALLVIILFMLLIWRGFVIALKAPDTFSSLVVIGLISKVAIQTLLNIAVVTNVIPNTGISLPFFSYGGTALVTQLAEMGIILSISRYSYQRDPD